MDGEGNKVKTKLMPNVYTERVGSLKTTTVKNGLDIKKRAHAVCANCRQSAFVCVAGARDDTHLFTVATKCYEKHHFVILVNKSSCFWRNENVRRV